MFYPFAMGGRYMIRLWLRQYAVTCSCQIFQASQLTKSIHPQLSCPKLMLSYFLPSKRIIELAQSRWAEKQSRKLCFYISCFVLLWRSLLRRIFSLAQRTNSKEETFKWYWHSNICHCHHLAFCYLSSVIAITPPAENKKRYFVTLVYDTWEDDIRERPLAETK